MEVPNPIGGPLRGFNKATLGSYNASDQAKSS